MVIYEPGDVIVKCKSFVHSVNEAEKGKICSNCLKLSNSLKKCSKCLEMFYCDRSCQEADWKYVHKLSECSILSRDGGKECPYLDTDFYRLLLRFVLKTTQEPDCLNTQFELFDGRTRRVDDLMDHLSDQEDIVSVKSMRLAAEYLTSLGIKSDVDLIIKRTHQLFTNSFQILNDSLERKVLGQRYEVASGLFIESSIFDHSCQSNASQVFDGNQIEIRALKQIDTEKEEIRISYVDLMETREKRRLTLRELHFFECSCSRCRSEAINEDNCREFESLKKSFQVFDKEEKHEKAYATVLKMITIVSSVLGQFSMWKSELFWLAIQFQLLQLQKRDQAEVTTELRELWGEYVFNIEVTHGRDHSIRTAEIFVQLKALLGHAS